MHLTVITYITALHRRSKIPPHVSKPKTDQQTSDLDQLVDTSASRCSWLPQTFDSQGFSWLPFLFTVWKVLTQKVETATKVMRMKMGRMTKESQLLGFDLKPVCFFLLVQIPPESDFRADWRKYFTDNQLVKDNQPVKHLSVWRAAGQKSWFCNLPSDGVRNGGVEGGRRSSAQPLTFWSCCCDVNLRGELSAVKIELWPFDEPQLPDPEQTEAGGTSGFSQVPPLNIRGCFCRRSENMDSCVFSCCSLIHPWNLCLTTAALWKRS